MIAVRRESQPLVLPQKTQNLLFAKKLISKGSTHRVFAPHYSYDEASAHFSAVHKVFGASNVSKMLLQLPLQCRGEAAIAIAYEALARTYDPVYGCVSHIFALQQQIADLQEEIEMLRIQMENIGHGNDSCATSEGSKILNNGLNSSIQTDSENPNYHRSDLFPFLPHVEGSMADPKLKTRVDMNQQQLSPLFQYENLFPIDKMFQGLDDFGCYNLGCLNLDDM